MKILVTGGAGFIGSNFIHYLLENTEHKIINLDAITYAGSKSNLKGILDHTKHEFIEDDIRNKELISEIIEDVDVIVNFAAESHVDRSIDSSKPFVSTNVQGTQNLLDCARNTELDSFIQISTDEVYGEITDGKFKEEDPLNPRNPYAATKASADLLARSFYTTYGVPIIITRSSNNYGPRQHKEKLIPKFINNAIKGKTLPIYGDGSNIREWTYVMDNCTAIHTILEKGNAGEIYNIGSGEELTNLEVTDKILKIVGKNRELIEFVEDRPGHDHRYALDTTKIENLGWNPKWSFKDGLKKTVKYYIKE